MRIGRANVSSAGENGSKNVSGRRYYRICERLRLRSGGGGEADTVTDPGWDIPGLPRDAAAGPAAGPAAALAGADDPAADRRRAGSRKSRPLASVSALAESSTGAFAPRRPRTNASADGDAPASIDASAADPASGVGVLTSSPTSSAAPPTAAPRLAADAAPAVGASSCSVRPADAAQALAFVSAGLEFLAHADPAEWPEGLQADCLRELAVAESRQAAAHARILTAFSVPGGGLNGDGHRSPRVWLTWQTAATRKAAGAKVAWMHQLASHPVIAAALAGGDISLSWARQITDWTDPLPDSVRDSADEELLAAAASGAGLSDLAGIAEELRRVHAEPDDDDGDGFEDRNLRLGSTFGGAGRLEGDLTPRCAAAAEAVIGALAQPRGPEDTRTLGQRQHDAFEE